MDDEMRAMFPVISIWVDTFINAVHPSMKSALNFESAIINERIHKDNSLRFIFMDSVSENSSICSA